MLLTEKYPSMSKGYEKRLPKKSHIALGIKLDYSLIHDESCRVLQIATDTYESWTEQQQIDIERVLTDLVRIHLNEHRKNV